MVAYITPRKEHISEDEKKDFSDSIERLEFIHDEVATLEKEAIAIRNKYPDKLWGYRYYTFPERE